MKKIFVGNLAWKVTADMLKQLFEAFGVVVSANVVTDQYTGQSRGFGFVVMENPDAASKAIAELNDKPLLDRNIRVSMAVERTERGGERGERSGGRGGDRGDRERGPRRNFGGGGGGGGGRQQQSYRQPRQSEGNFYE